MAIDIELTESLLELMDGFICAIELAFDLFLPLDRPSLPLGRQFAVLVIQLTESLDLPSVYVLAVLGFSALFLQ